MASNFGTEIISEINQFYSKILPYRDAFPVETARDTHRIGFIVSYWLLSLTGKEVPSPSTNSFTFNVINYLNDGPCQ